MNEKWMNIFCLGSITHRSLPSLACWAYKPGVCNICAVRSCRSAVSIVSTYKVQPTSTTTIVRLYTWKPYSDMTESASKNIVKYLFVCLREGAPPSPLPPLLMMTGAKQSGGGETAQTVSSDWCPAWSALAPPLLSDHFASRTVRVSQGQTAESRNIPSSKIWSQPGWPESAQHHWLGNTNVSEGGSQSGKLEM